MKTLISSSDRAFIDFKELRGYGGLLRYLSLRDVFVRYKQTLMGFGWSLVRPLINMIIFGFFSYLVDRTGSFSDRFITVAGAVVFWQLISTAITEVSNSLTANANILTKVYFPKLILPLSSLLVTLVDFAIAFILFMVLYAFLWGAPHWQLIFLPLVLLHALIFSLAIGLFAATAAVKYRDVKFILPFVIQILFYSSPVFISSTFVLERGLPEWLKVLYQLNPLVFMLNSFKYSVFGLTDALEPVYGLCSILLTLILFWLSIRYFTRFERNFADYI